MASEGQVSADRVYANTVVGEEPDKCNLQDVCDSVGKGSTLSNRWQTCKRRAGKGRDERGKLVAAVKSINPSGHFGQFGNTQTE